MVDVTCYVQAGKSKSKLLCEAFASGVQAAGGKAALYSRRCDSLRPGAAAFYGVRADQRHLLDQAKAEPRDWYYIDNAYFDATREVYFRITRNRLQHRGAGDSDGARFARLAARYGVEINPWRKSGTHVLVCPQSDPFLELFCEDGAKWTERTVARLKALTGRPIRVRPWQSNKVEWYATLPEDLRDCWALVTYSSASAITAMCEGIPAFVGAEDCISRMVANRELEQIDTPFYWRNLQPWANVVADNQFSLEEIGTGYAWRRLQEDR